MMRLPKFEYHTPQTIAEAVKIMAGVGPEGQLCWRHGLYPNMKRRQQMPNTVISVMRLAELNQITGDGAQGLRIGALITLTDVCEHPIINRDYPVVAQAARTISTRFFETWEPSAEIYCSTLVAITMIKTTSGAGINFCLKRMATFAGSRRAVRSAGPCSHRIWSP